MVTTLGIDLSCGITKVSTTNDPELGQTTLVIISASEPSAIFTLVLRSDQCVEIGKALQSVPEGD